jgi:hypothetical protein
MSKLLIISENSEISLWVRLGHRIFKSSDYKIEDHTIMMSFINKEKPEVIYVELKDDIEAVDINELLRNVNSFPLNVIVLEAALLKINIFSMLSHLNFIERLFPPHKVVSE